MRLWRLLKTFYESLTFCRAPVRCNLLTFQENKIHYRWIVDFYNGCFNAFLLTYLSIVNGEIMSYMTYFEWIMLYVTYFGRFLDGKYTQLVYFL